MFYRATCNLHALLLFCLLCVSITTLNADELKKLDRPLPFPLIKQDLKRLKGKIEAFNNEGISYLPSGSDTPVFVPFKSIKATLIAPLINKLFQPKTAEDYTHISQILSVLGQERASQDALKKAKLKANVKAKQAKVLQSQQTKNKRPPINKPVDPNDRYAWPILTDEALAQATEEMKTYSDALFKKVNLDVRLIETKYFLVYSDLSAKDINSWIPLFDRLYMVMAKAFTVDKQNSIWHGKCVIIILQSRDDWLRMETKGLNVQVRENTAGLCHYRGKKVIVTFPMPRSQKSFGRILVHEVAHGFTYRYRTARSLPSWVNEGLSEMYEAALAGGDWIQYRDQTAINRLRQNGRLGANFWITRGNISFDDYPIAANLMNFLYKTNKKYYISFFNDMKDGVPWQESLEKNYKMTLQQIVSIFGQTMRVPALRP